MQVAKPAHTQERGTDLYILGEAASTKWYWAELVMGGLEDKEYEVTGVLAWYKTKWYWWSGGSGAESLRLQSRLEGHSQRSSSPSPQKMLPPEPTRDSWVLMPLKPACHPAKKIKNKNKKQMIVFLGLIEIPKT